MTNSRIGNDRVGCACVETNTQCVNPAPEHRSEWSRQGGGQPDQSLVHSKCVSGSEQLSHRNQPIYLSKEGGYSCVSWVAAQQERAT